MTHSTRVENVKLVGNFLMHMMLQRTILFAVVEALLYVETKKILCNFKRTPQFFYCHGHDRQFQN